MPLAVFTGGGTAGHIIPGLAVISELQELGWRTAWIGSRRANDRGIVRAYKVPFYSIPAGKLRRYFSLYNLSDVALVIAGCVHALLLLIRLRPDVLFAKGSYVSVPPVIAAKLLRIPIITHESDATPALATRINASVAHTILVSFAATRCLFPTRLRHRIQVTGNPLRRGLHQGNRQKGRDLVNAPAGLPILFVTGGSSGAQTVNDVVYNALAKLTRHWFVVHQTGSQWTPPSITPSIKRRYKSVPFIFNEFSDLLAAADVVVCRAGANTLGELAATRTPAVLIPLPRTQSRGEQIENAKLFVSSGAALLLAEENACSDSLVTMLDELRVDECRRRLMEQKMADLASHDATRKIAAIVNTIIRPVGYKNFCSGTESSESGLHSLVKENR